MNRHDCDKWCGGGILALVLVIFVFAALAFGGTGLWEFLVIQALTVGVLALWLVRLWVSPKPRLLWPPIAWCALAFALYAVGRYLTCDIEYVGRHEFLQVLVFTCLFLAILNNTYHQEMLLTASYVLIFLAMATASYALCQYATGSSRVWTEFAEEPGRATGTFFSADHFCAYCEMILPLLLAVLLVGRIKALTRIWLGYSFLVILGGVAVTFSRAGWAATALGLLLVLLALLGHRNHRKFAALVLVLLVIGGGLFVTRYLAHTPSFQERVVDSEGKVNTDLFVRVEIWTAAKQMWLDHFWWGVGPDHFDYRFNEYRPELLQMRAGRAHCDYLNLLTDWGVVGGGIVLVAIGCVLVGIARTWGRVRRAENDFRSGLSNRYALFLGAIGGLAAIALHSLVDFGLHVPADALVALTLMAILSASQRFATDKHWNTLRLPLKAVVSVFLMVAFGYLGWQTVRLGNEARWLVPAAKAPPYTLAQAKLCERAFRWEPMNFENAYNIGEGYRNAGLLDAAKLGETFPTALDWYDRSSKLNPYYTLNYLREGGCLDVLGYQEAAAKCFDHADLLDPNGYFTAANIGWHYLQIGELAAARPCLQRSLELQARNNPIAATCQLVVEQRMAQDAGNFPDLGL